MNIRTLEKSGRVTPYMNLKYIMLSIDPTLVSIGGRDCLVTPPKNWKLHFFLIIV